MSYPPLNQRYTQCRPAPFMSESFVAIPMPDVEDLGEESAEADSQSMHSERSSITRPTRAFFLGCRESQIIDVRALEEGRSSSNSPACGGDTSHSTLVNNTPAMATPSTMPAFAPQRSAAPAVAAPLPGPVPARHPLRRLSTSISLPPKKGARAWRFARYNFGSVYRRIFTLAFITNIIVLAVLGARPSFGGRQLAYQDCSVAVSANIFAALLVRNEHVVNALFIVFGTWPKNMPLRVRRLCAKVYSYGGIHSGCGVAATFWYAAFVVLLTLDYQRRDGAAELSALRGYVYLVTYAVFFMLVLILVFAHPRLRVTIHNWFEGVHRFLGWSVVLLFWAQTLLVTFDDAAPAGLSHGAALIRNPAFWLLVLITLLVIYPWTRLRLRDVEAEPLSKHCIKLNFNFQNGHYGQAIRLTDAPLRETHAFAVIPNPKAAAGPFLATLPPLPAPTPPGTSSGERPSASSDDIEAIKAAARARALARQHHAARLAELSAITLSNAGKTGFSVVISDAGDWTRKIIANPPTKMYTRGIPQYGVLRVAGMFEPVIVMATGSGIAPCLALFAEMPDHPVRVIWSAPSPLETFGQGVVDTVLRADPDAIIHDTRKSGRPDLVQMAYRVWVGSRRQQGVHGTDPEKRNRRLGPCEAVVIISNQKVTRKVVYGLESRGVAAYGAIFDS